VHFTPEQLNRMTDDQLDRAEAAYTTLVALEQEVASRLTPSGRASVRGPQTAPGEPTRSRPVTPSPSALHPVPAGGRVSLHHVPDPRHAARLS
jgi:hypothetical protein